MKEDPEVPDDQMKLEGSNAINGKDCNHLFIKYPPVIGKIKTCIKCGILLAPGGIQGGYNTVRLSGNHIEMTVATAPANPASGLVRMYATSATSVRMRDSAGTETDLAGAGAVTRAGGNTTEATTTSLTSVDLLSATITSTAVGTPVLVMVSTRKTTGAAEYTRYGLKLNTTVVFDGQAILGNSNEAVSQLQHIGLTYGTASYLRSLWYLQDSSLAQLRSGSSPADMPTASLTDVVIRRDTDDALITAGADDLHCYTYSVA